MVRSATGGELAITYHTQFRQRHVLEDVKRFF